MSRLYDPGIQPFTVTLDTVTNTNGSYTHATQNSSITAAMKPIQIECSNPDAFGDNITITTSAGEITLTCNEVAGTSDVTVTLMQQVAEAFRPLETTSTEFDILNNKIAAVQNEIGIVINGNTATQNVAKGQYVIVKNSTITDITDGLYTAATEITAGTAFISTNLIAETAGGLNVLSNNKLGYLDWNKAKILTDMRTTGHTYIAPQNGMYYAIIAPTNTSGAYKYTITINGFEVIMGGNYSSAFARVPLMLYVKTGDTIIVTEDASLAWGSNRGPFFIPQI